MSQQSQIGPHMANQTSEFPPQYQQFQNRQEFSNNQYFGPDAGFRSNGMRPEGFNHPLSQSASPQVKIKAVLQDTSSLLFEN